jgi:hypothetical protein
MAINKIFTNLDVNKVARKRQHNFTTSLEAVICEYAFSVIWTRQTACNLNFLSGNRPPSTTWHPIITAPISDDDGEISVQLGHFPPGITLNLSWGIQAVDAIPKLALLIVNITNRTIFKIPPGNQFKQLARGEFWQSNAAIILP